MKSTCILVALLPVSISGQLQKTSDDLVVDLGYVRYMGSHNATSRINSWFGMRYAQAPVGELRWQPPLDIEYKNNYSRTQPMDASKPGPSCMQGYPAWFGIQGNLTRTEDEDCLLLDVIAPAEPESDNLPVMVQIHGGGYTLGASQPRAGPGFTIASYLSSAPGNALVYQSRGNIVYVTIQYRLGAYGFLGGAEIANNGASNVGLLDQRAALMWVQRHISKFGGDPAQVTMIGGSAGGASAVDQMIVYGGVSNPPFRAVIAEYPWMQPYHNSSTLEKQFQILRDTSGCSDLDCLRRLSRTELRSAVDQTYVKGYHDGDYGQGDFFYGPYVDGIIIRDLSSNELKQGHFTKVPLLASREGYEGYSFTNMSQNTSMEVGRGLNRLFPDARQSFFNRLFQLYPPSVFNSTAFRRSAMFSDAVVSCPSSWIAAALADHGMPTWKFTFYAGSQTHGALIPFVETVELEGASNNATLASILRNYYLSLTTSLDPNARHFTNVSVPTFPQYQSPGTPGFKILSISDTTIRPSEDLDVRPQCDFSFSQNYAIRN